MHLPSGKASDWKEIRWLFIQVIVDLKQKYMAGGEHEMNEWHTATMLEATEEKEASSNVFVSTLNNIVNPNAQMTSDTCSDDASGCPPKDDESSKNRTKRPSSASLAR